MFARATATCLLGLAAAVAQEPKLAGDLARLQGIWKAKAGPDASVEITLMIRGDRAFYHAVAADGQPIVVSSRIALDENARPRTLDATHRTLPDGRIMPDVLALYEIEGDILRICNNGPGKPRPTEFRAGHGDLPIITVYQRVKVPEPDPR